MTLKRFSQTAVHLRLLRELSNPSKQRPSLNLFVGRKFKDSALRELFPWNSLKSSRREGIVTVGLDNATSQSEYPIFFAASDPFILANRKEAVSHPSHQVSVNRAQWRAPDFSSLYDIVHARILCLFADVICLFVDDFGDFEDVVQLLRSWALSGPATSQFLNSRPRVILVKRGTDLGSSSTYDLLESTHFEDQLPRPEIVAMFASLTVFHIAGTQISPLSRYRRLKELIQRHTDEARHAKESDGCSCSASHLSCLVKLAIEHTALTSVEPFDYIRATRSRNPLDKDFVEHVKHFLSIETTCSLRDKIAHVASVILMDAYPIGMHGELSINARFSR